MQDEILAGLDSAADAANAEIAALTARLASKRDELKRINKARAALDPSIGQARVLSDPSGFTAEVEKLLAQGPLTKVEISRLIGGHRSRASYALSALEKRGLVAATGEVRERSAEYRLVEA